MELRDGALRLFYMLAVASSGHYGVQHFGPQRVRLRWHASLPSRGGAAAGMHGWWRGVGGAERLVQVDTGGVRSSLVASPCAPDPVYIVPPHGCCVAALC